MLCGDLEHLLFVPQSQSQRSFFVYPYPTMILSYINAYSQRKPDRSVPNTQPLSPDPDRPKPAQSARPPKLVVHCHHRSHAVCHHSQSNTSPAQKGRRKRPEEKLTVIRLTNVGILPLPAAAAAVVEEESDRVALLLRETSRCVLRI
jgi:hypothetical protein